MPEPGVTTRSAVRTECGGMIGADVPVGEHDPPTDERSPPELFEPPIEEARLGAHGIDVRTDLVVHPSAHDSVGAFAPTAPHARDPGHEESVCGARRRVNARAAVGSQPEQAPGNGRLDPGTARRARSHCARVGWRRCDLDPRRPCGRRCVMRSLALALLLGGCGGSVWHPLYELGHWWEHDETVAPGLGRVTQRFDAPIVRVVHGERAGCAVLDDGWVECWGTGSIGSRSSSVPWRTRFRLDDASVRLDGDLHRVRDSDATSGGYRPDDPGVLSRCEEPVEPNDLSPSSAPFEDGRCSFEGAAIECVFPPPSDGLICIWGHTGQRCEPYAGPFRMIATEPVRELLRRDGTVCALLGEGRYECWFIPPPRPVVVCPDAVSLGILVGVEPPIVGGALACGVHLDDRRALTCIGREPLGAESLAGPVGDPRDPWSRRFASGLVVRDGGSADARPSVAGGAATVDAMVAVPEFSCRTSADHVLECRDEGEVALRMPGVREHLQTRTTLYWIDLDGRAWCAGGNEDIECQDDAGPWVPFPHALPIPAARHLCAGIGFACAVTTEGAVWCWGANRALQITGPSLLDAAGALTATRDDIVAHVRDAPLYAAPIEVLPTGAAVDVACGAWTVCVLREDGTSYCW